MIEIRFTVIIPFYAIDGGLLTRSVSSIAAQRLPPGDRIKVIVVDDDSPTRPELQCSLPPHVELTIVRRLNGGAGAARNTGIMRALSEPTDALAFLDCDDEWTPLHLARARGALLAGADFYFDDHREDFASLSYFEQLSGGPLNGSLPFTIFGEAREDVLFDPVLALARNFLAQPSTIVIAPSLSYLRFDETTVVEDYIYSFDLALAARRVAVSMDLGVVKGRGVNIFSGPVSRQDASYLHLLSEELLQLVRMRAAASASDAAIRTALDAQVRQRGQRYLRFAMRWLVTGHGRTTVRHLKTLVRRHPAVLAQLPASLAGIAMRTRT